MAHDDVPFGPRQLVKRRQDGVHGGAEEARGQGAEGQGEAAGDGHVVVREHEAEVLVHHARLQPLRRGCWSSGVCINKKGCRDCGNG